MRMKYKFYLLKMIYYLVGLIDLWFKNQSLVGNLICHSGLSGIVPLSLINNPDKPE